MKFFKKYRLPMIFKTQNYSEISRHDDINVRVRFAPSPTGYLHLGGLRTALYNFLFSKSKNGTFILRIEDTDQSRLVDNAIEKLEDDLKWAGLNPDEGPSVGGPFGPYLQSQRLDLYKEEVNNLLASGNAYYCFCSDRRLNLLRRDALRRREIPKYDNYCRHLSIDEVHKKLKTETNFCVRFKLTPYLRSYHDLIFGIVVNNIAEVEGDPVILKSDGFPTYHLANVVDDHYMKITHVLRGVEWQPSTVKHLLLYNAFKWDPPKYAHLPLLLNTDGTKLSKRHGNVTIDAFRKQEIYPHAVINFITLCGGGFLKTENSQSDFALRSIEELIKKFSLDLILSKNSQVPLDRLNEFNRAVLKQLISDEEQLNEIIKVTRNIIEKYCFKKNCIPVDLSDMRIKRILVWSVNRISKLTDFIEPQFSFLWIEPSEELMLKYEKDLFDSLSPLIMELEKIEKYDEEYFSVFLKKFSKENELKYSKFMKFLRSCLSGLKEGPGVSEIITVLGKELVLRRLKNAQSLKGKFERN